MNHHLNADPWYRQAAQSVLDTAQIQDLHGPLHHGQSAAYLVYSGTQGRLVVVVGTQIGDRLIDTRPPPRKAHERTQWEQARTHISQIFEKAGFPTPRIVQLGLAVDVPAHLGTPAHIQLERTGPGRYTARIDDHPDLVADIDGRLEVPTSHGFTLTSSQGVHRGDFDTEIEAAHAFAFDCGFGPHITVTS